MDRGSQHCIVQEAVIKTITVRGIGITAELFQILKDDAVKVLHSICQQIWKTQHSHRTGKGQLSFQTQKKTIPKNVQTTIQLRSFHMLAKEYSEHFKLGFNSM